MRSSPGTLEEAANEAQASAEEHRRRLDNKQRLRELRIKRLRAKVPVYGASFYAKSDMPLSRRSTQGRDVPITDDRVWFPAAIALGSVCLLRREV